MSAKPTTRRRNTIWDLADLRIRPDGTRIAQDLVDGTRAANSRTLKEGNSVVMTSHGWIANEAGGSLPGVRKRRIRRKKTENDSDAEMLDVDADIVGETSQAGKKRKAWGTGKTAQRRRKLDEDLWFITNKATPKVPLNPDGTPYVFPTPPATRPLPDSDLIKTIHYMASKYYTERDYMHDLPAQHRAARRVRKAAHLQEKEKERALAEGRDPGPQVEYKEDWAPWVLGPKPGRRKKEDEIPKGMIPKDMYRAFNHSAIMCIGMLLQEHIWSNVAPRPQPEGWTDPPQSYYEQEEDLDGPETLDPSNLASHAIFRRARPVRQLPRRDQFWTEEDEAAAREQVEEPEVDAEVEEEPASGSEYDPDEDEYE